jgi:hypothetical protein
MRKMNLRFTYCAAQQQPSPHLLRCCTGERRAASGRPAKWRRLIQLLALLHYASGFALIAATGDDELAYLAGLLRITPEFIVLRAVVYVVGQVTLW